MKRLSLTLLAAAALGLPLLARAAEWHAVPLVDQMCKAKVEKDPDAHPVSCLLQCARSGYGIMSEGKWLKLDAQGNREALAALKATSKKDHIRVDVTGDLSGDTVKVASLAIAP